MKSLIPIFLLSLIGVGASAQRVPVTTDGVTYRADEGAVAAWQAQHSPVLHGFPLDTEIRLTAGVPAAFNFQKAARVVLVVDPAASHARGVLECTDSDGKVIARQQLNRSDQRVILEIPQATFTLVFEQSSGKSDELHITHVYLIPPVRQEGSRDFGFNTALTCYPNANCPEGAPWSNEVRSAVRIMMVLQEGVGWCSGALMNNTAGDGTPYILSAEHCLAQYTPMWDLWRFDFNYRSSDCMNPGEEPAAQSITGCSLRAKQRDTDFLLLELNNPVPVFFNAYFSGWNRTPDYAPGKIVLIHHPSGDITKMSTDFHEIRLWENVLNWSEGYSTPENTHYRSRFDLGTF
ncbi:MAG: hypothetical protein R3330_15570, partial [Saprospiraceae bacterium]|nr:hypothetical protein [Saprospiraceae bacterium]